MTQSVLTTEIITHFVCLQASLPLLDLSVLRTWRAWVKAGRKCWWNWSASEHMLPDIAFSIWQNWVPMSFHHRALQGTSGTIHPVWWGFFFQSVNSMDWLLEHAVVILVLFLNSWQFSLWPTEGSQMSEVFLSHWVSLRYTRSVDNSQEWVGMKDRARPWIYTNLPTERVQIFWWGQNGRWTHVAQGFFYFFLRWN